MPTNKNTISYHYKKAYIIGLSAIEDQARNVLRLNLCLDEFVMCMGTYFFTAKCDIPNPFCLNRDSDIIHDFMGDNEDILNSLKGYKKLTSYIEKWDPIFQLTGEPMRFTAKGKKITNW